MRDSELAASIVDGDPEALAETYDKYADLLWSYCRSLLGDADNAAEAVTDTFVIAASRLDVLPTFGRLRAWLYAVARSECLRRMRTTKNGAAPYEAERLRRAAHVLSTGEQRQLRALLTTAFGGLDEAERDVMQMVWHGLDLAEVAAVLGLTRSDAYAQFTRARDQLEASVGVLLIGWSGRGGCDDFEDMLYGKDSRLTPDLRARASRHIAKCEVCADRYRRQMRPSLMLCLSVGALLSEAADARAAASRAPRGLWEDVYRMTSQEHEESRWHKILGSRRMSFGPDGFPKQVAAGRDGLGRAPLKVAAVGTVAVAATATGWATHGHFTASPDASTNSSTHHGISVVAPDGGAAAPAVSKGAHAGAPSTKTSSNHKPAHAKPSSASASSPSASADPSALPVAGGSAVSVSTPAASASASTSSSSGSGSGSSSGSGSGSNGNGNGSGSSAPAAGTLSVSKSNIAVTGLSSASFTLTANGGPVTWSISAPSQLLGGVTLSATSGTLQAGQSVTITVTGKGLLTLDEPLTISPGGQTVTVDVSLL